MQATLDRTPSARARLIALNAIGGAAVLASYAVGLLSHPETSGAVWGGVPEGLKPVYTVNMFLAAAGYFPMTAWLLFSAEPSRVRIAGRYGFGALFALYGLVLLPSALWMPLTFRMLEAPSTWLWWVIRVDLLAVGAGALGLLVALVTWEPRRRGLAWGLAVLGCGFFVFQTAVLDALVWPAYFPR